MIANPSLKQRWQRVAKLKVRPLKNKLFPDERIIPWLSFVGGQEANGEFSLKISQLHTLSKIRNHQVDAPIPLKISLWVKPIISVTKV